MAIGMDQLFNSSLEVGQFINSSNTNLTGSPFLTLIIILAVLILIAALFKMPETLYLIPLIPVIIIFSLADVGMKIILGVAALIFAYILYQLMPWH